MHERTTDLPITSGDGTVHVSAQLTRGRDDRATITSYWKAFILRTNMVQGNIYVFVFKHASAGLRLTIYSL